MKTQADIYKALLDGKIVESSISPDKVKLIDGLIYSSHKDSTDWVRADWSFSNPEHWIIRKEPEIYEGNVRWQNGRGTVIPGGGIGINWRSLVGKTTKIRIEVIDE